jgi:hypothetical protein
VRFAKTGYAFAVPGNEAVVAAVVVVGDANDDESPHVNEIDASAFPFPVRWPFNVAVVGCTFVAGVVVELGVPHGVAAIVALSKPVFELVIARIEMVYSVPFVRPVIERGLVVDGVARATNVSPPSMEYW